ncbi:MAG TPA: PAS domain S-box protein [Verrucomicrobiae bacterium]|nr:PAS domain S-box protein [Verrucomicrobiae bacterium]
MRLSSTFRAAPSGSNPENWRRTEGRQWWLASTGILVTLLLTFGIVSFVLPALIPGMGPYSVDAEVAVRALVGLVLLFDLYVIFQQVQLFRARKQIAEREELFRLITENAADMIAVVDGSGNRLYNSPSYQRLLGYSPEELRQSKGIEQVHPDDRQKVIEAAIEAQRSGVGRSLEYRIRHKDGHWVPLESTASVIKSSGGGVEKLVIVNRDVTERKDLEKKLLLSEKLEAIGKLSGGVAHDFNNLLGVILGYTSELQKRIPPDDPYREAVDEIQNAGKRAASLTQQLLAFSRKQVFEPQILDLKTIVAEAAKMLERLIGEDITLDIVSVQQMGMVKADRGQIERVILNLAVNARDAMPQGGTITIEIADVELDESNHTLACTIAPGSYVMLKVTDTGCGMDAELQSHIFEPFFTTKGQGTGLGLATVYGVVKQSGGEIAVESSPGKGATFRIYLPRVSETAEKIHVVEPSGKTILEHRTVLLVEDERTLRKLTRKMLTEVGLTVLEAENGLQAIEMAERTESPIDLLLTDIVMPGMSGWALAETLSSQRPEMRVLYMSGYPDGVIARHGIAGPGITILQKPFTSDELTRRVEEVTIGVAG